MKKTKEVVKEEGAPVSGDRVEQSADQAELPTDKVVVEDEKVEESKEPYAGISGVKDMEMKDAPKSKKVEESKKKLTKEQIIAEIAKKVVERLRKK